jgi:hypothetical protein
MVKSECDTFGSKPTEVYSAEKENAQLRTALAALKAENEGLRCDLLLMANTVDKENLRAEIVKLLEKGGER